MEGTQRFCAFFLLSTVVIFTLGQANADCCHSISTPSASKDINAKTKLQKICLDGEPVGAGVYCGVSGCNMFGCNCDGGCRRGPNFEENKGRAIQIYNKKYNWNFTSILTCWKFILRIKLTTSGSSDLIAVRADKVVSSRGRWIFVWNISQWLRQLSWMINSGYRWYWSHLSRKKVFENVGR